MPINEIDIYDQAVGQLKHNPDSPALQHRAVLALARAGSLDFALKEYKRYGLDKILDHSDKGLLEDIISLNGRLLKDLYLSTSGKAAQNYAQQSSEKYEQAFELTGGYYSAINAATMALIADMPTETIKQRADKALRASTHCETVNSETKYFVEATRAEAALLLGQQYQAQRMLLDALQHDPQNYPAHATTLNQLEMILKKRGESCDWLHAFKPPKPVHFSGHLFKLGNHANTGEMDNADYAKLRIDISDAIQRQNIGFGFGALAAGADIVFAEAILEEGGAFHAILPVSPDIFVQHSVKPFGQDWEERFQTCWEAANSRQIISTKPIWPDSQIDDFTSRVAMGKTVQMAQRFSVPCQQFLLWDKQVQNHGTALNAAEWAASNRSQTIFPYPGRRRTVETPTTKPEKISIKATLHQKQNDETFTFTNLTDAVNYALDLQSKHNYRLRIGLHVDISLNDKLDLSIAKKLSCKALPGSIFVSEVAASLILFEHENQYALDFIGQCETPKNIIRIFALKPKP